MQGFYARLKKTSNHDAKLQECVTDVVDRLEDCQTSLDQPGMLLGKIQSGKTRGFLGIIAEAFDRDYDIALVLTKGTRTLAKQTVSRISHDFKEFIDDDEIAVYDIMEMPDPLTRSELRKKLIIIAKKEANNLKRVINFFQNEEQPKQVDKKLLLVDDEADMASVRFQKKNNDEDYSQGTIAQLIDDLRSIVKRTAFLQVTATPYALYLQPEEYEKSASNPFSFFCPKRPSFTVLLPIHSGYVGGEDYFGDYSQDDPRSYLHVKVSENEHAALRSGDGRKIREDHIWSSQNIKALRQAVMTFLVSVTIRRIQQETELPRPRKYAMIIHNDTQKSAHTWQYETVEKIRIAFESAAANSDPKFTDLFTLAYEDLSRSVLANGDKLPEKGLVLKSVIELITDGELIVQRVNSDVQVAPLLDPTTAELRLRTPANIFIGGSLLDRGITIPNLISFYYGRNPKRMQADTVLQHSRMYGNRDRKDLAVTRFYTSVAVHDRLRKIDKLENALREEFSARGANTSIVFIQNDSHSGIIPCAPNKVAMSDITTVRATDYYAPSSFDTIGGKVGQDCLQRIDSILLEKPESQLFDMPLNDVLEIIDIAKKAISLEEGGLFDWLAMTSLMNYYSKINDNGIVKVLVATDRAISQKSSDKSGKSLAGGDTIRKMLESSRSAPAIVMTRQNGVNLDWKGNMAFWLPILVSPTNTEPCVFAK